jgi:hypothetical protein
MTGAPVSLARALFCAGAILVTAALIWAAGSFVDLRDGSTWRQRTRGEARRDGGPLFRHVDARTNPSDFKLVVVLRGVMPVVLLGTAGTVFLLGAAGQHYVPRS